MTAAAAVAARTAARRAPRRRPRALRRVGASVHVAVAHDATHVQHLRGRAVGGNAFSFHRVTCRAHDALIAPLEPRARNQWRSISPMDASLTRWRRLPTLGRVIQNRDGRRSFARSGTPVLFRSPTRPARLGSARLGSAWLGLARLGLARPTTRSYAAARGLSARERSPSESHACQRRPAQIMVGRVERRGGGCGDCGYETRGRRRSFLVAYVVSSLSLPFTRSVPLPPLARTLSAPRSAAAAAMA